MISGMKSTIVELPTFADLPGSTSGKQLSHYIQPPSIHIISRTDTVTRPRRTEKNEEIGKLFRCGEPPDRSFLPGDLLKILLPVIRRLRGGLLGRLFPGRGQN